MSTYVDGFVIPVARKNLPAYLRLAKKCAAIFREHGALEVRECVGEDLAVKMGRPFTQLAKTKRSETVVFSWISYKSRAHRDRVNAKFMKDPRVAALCGGPNDGPFDCKRMAYGGFSVMVSA